MTDLVERLRKMGGIGCEAADEIERLRERPRCAVPHLGLATDQQLRAELSARAGVLTTPEIISIEQPIPVDDLIAEIEWLQTLLNGRDRFIVDHGLWKEFTHALPRLGR